jgi:T5orf172 domain
MAALGRDAEMDVAFRLKLKDLNERLPYFALTRFEGGSGFPIALILRTFFLEYFDRLIKAGPFSLPTSFNVVQSFLSFSEQFLSFDIREEREHLLRFDEYIDWYTASSFPDKPLALTEILPEGIVYGYNAIAPLEDFAIETEDSSLRILGIAMVRHAQELSAMIVAGENPPFPTDDEVKNEIRPDTDFEPFPGKEALQADPSYELKDRYVPGLPDHARVIMLSRFDLEHSKYDVRYVNLDVGKGYMVLTDDRTVLQELENYKDREFKLDERLERYSALFSASASLLYLPAFFADQGSRIIETKFATGLHGQKRRSMIRNALKILGASQVPFFKTIRCLVDHPSTAKISTLTVQPPNMDFKSSGYWRPLASGAIGESKDGTPIVGKTWVKRTETWTERSLSSFVVSKTSREIIGPDPGWIYIMRSGSHYDDLYKIGLTRRSGEERSIELSGATGVPTGFEVLAKWAVGDCSKVERESHERLKALRVNKRREFFRGNLQEIILLINEVVISSQTDA